MNNNRSSICIRNNTDLDVLIWQIGAFLYPIFGLPGHFIIIITRLNSHQRRSEPISLYFIFIAIAESIYLIFMLWDWLDVINLLPDPRRILDCAFFYPFVSGTGFISLVLFAQLNLDRIYIINKPQKTSPALTHTRIFIKILLTFSTLLLFIIHYRYSVYYDPQAFIIFGQSCRVHKNAHQWFYFIWPYVHLLSRLAPCTVLFFCTIYIFYNRCYGNCSRTNFLHRQQQTFSLALVFVSIYIFLAVIPISIIQIYNQRMCKYEFECSTCNCIEYNAKKWKLINTICIMWEASIYMNKFYIKLLISSEFRHDVKQLMFARSKTYYIHRKTNSIENGFSSLE